MSEYVFDQKPNLDDLEHYGVKGQKWGVRRETAGSGEQKTSKKKRAVQVAAVVGVVAVGAILAHRSGVRMSSFSSSSSVTSGQQASQDVLRRIGNERFSAIPMPPVRPAPRARVRTPGSSSRANEAAALRSSIANSIRQANRDLRERDNALGIPFAERSYLTEWD